MEESSIPVENIFYLLCYAWDSLAFAENVAIKEAEHKSVANLLTRVLLNGMTTLLKGGLHRDYLEREEERVGLKGRFKVAESISRMSLYRGSAVCCYDEFDQNIIHNRILKTTLRLLINTRDVSSKYRDEASQLYRRLEGVAELTLSSRLFKQARVHRHNKHYRFLLHICELIWYSILPTESSGKYQFRDFFQERAAMANLFEKFVRNFYRKELKAYDVRSEQIPWATANLDPESQEVLPAMLTDISLTSLTSPRKIIIDTKFYESALIPKKHSSSEIELTAVRSAHLYQIIAYLTNSRYRAPDFDYEGVLLYPTNGCDFCFRWSILGHRISARTINLNQPWPVIHNDLLRLIDPDRPGVTFNCVASRLRADS